MFWLLIVFALSLWLTGLAPSAAAEGAPYCGLGEDPHLSPRVSPLVAAFGEVLGEPLECPHLDEAGNEVQNTSVGQILYVSNLRLPIFTMGDQYWAVGPAGPVQGLNDGRDLIAQVLSVSEATVQPTSVSPSSTAPVSAAPPPVVPALLTEADIAARSAPSVVQVLTGDGAGSGVSVGAGILTNEHVVHGFERVDLFTSDGRRFGASVRSTDVTRDLALLSPDLPLPTLEMELAGQQRQGDQLLVLGYPRPSILGIGGQASLTRGLLSAIRQDNGLTLVQTDATVNPGNSGGPVLNMRGSVIGVVSFGLRGNVGLNFAIGTESIQAFLAAPLAIAQSAGTPTLSTPVLQPFPSATAMPAGPIFTGAPRQIALQPADLGPGWAIVSQDQNDGNQYSSGPLFTRFRQGNKQSAPYLFTAVEVYYKTDTVENTVRNNSSSPEKAPMPCDDGSTAHNDDGTVVIRCRVKNVALTVNWASYDMTVQALNLMAARVNAGAR